MNGRASDNSKVGMSCYDMYLFGETLGLKGKMPKIDGSRHDYPNILAIQKKNALGWVNSERIFS